MGWIDEARARLSKGRAEAEAEGAKAAKRWAAHEAREKDRFTSWLERKLPHGVELVSVDTPNNSARVHVGDGVEFVLVHRKWKAGSNYISEYEAIWVFETGSEPWGQYLVGYTYGGTNGGFIYPRGAPLVMHDIQAYLDRSDMENVLQEALEKYEASRESR